MSTKTQSAHPALNSLRHVEASPPSRHWQRFVSRDFQSPRTNGGVAPFFAESAAPKGPFKLVPGSKRGTVRIIADLPLALGRFQHQLSSEALPESFVETPNVDPREFLSARDDGSVQLWAEELRATLRRIRAREGKAPAAPRNAANSENGKENQTTDLIGILTARGWKPSQHDSGVRVNFESSEYFAQAELHLTPAGVIAEVNLARTQNWQPQSLAAAARLALQVNQQLKLVRLVHRVSDSGSQILAQVHFGGQPIDSPWLDVALSVLRDASESLARETPLLARQDIAEWILSTRC